MSVLAPVAPPPTTRRERLRAPALTIGGLALATVALFDGIWGTDAIFVTGPGWFDETTTILGARVGFLRGDYGHDLAENPRFPTWPCTFDPMHAYRPLVEAARAGRQAVRLFLCEGAEGIRVDGDGAVLGVSERLLEAIEVVQEGAALHGLYLYWSLLDAGAVAEGDTITGSILEGGAQVSGGVGVGGHARIIGLVNRFGHVSTRFSRTRPRRAVGHGSAPALLEGQRRTPMLFRQLFDHASSTYTYLVADPETREAALIDAARVVEAAKKVCYK